MKCFYASSVIHLHTSKLKAITKYLKNMAASVHGGHVVKSDRVVFQQLVLNKHWLPDDMLNEIKDFLYISAAEVLRKYYKVNLNRSITDMVTMSSYMIDVYGRQRLAHWAIGHIYGDGRVQLQGTVCVTCGDLSERHQNMNGCCALVLDEVDEPLYLVDDDTVPDVDIPEVTWGIDIPVLQQQQQAYDDYDREAEAADYAEYMQEVEMEMYLNRR